MGLFQERRGALTSWSCTCKSQVIKQKRIFHYLISQLNMMWLICAFRLENWARAAVAPVPGLCTKLLLTLIQPPVTVTTGKHRLSESLSVLINQGKMTILLLPSSSKEGMSLPEFRVFRTRHVAQADEQARIIGPISRTDCHFLSDVFAFSDNATTISHIKYLLLIIHPEKRKSKDKEIQKDQNRLQLVQFCQRNMSKTYGHEEVIYETLFNSKRKMKQKIVTAAKISE